MEFARRAAPQKIAKKARFMKSSRIREKSPDLRYFADVTCVFLDRIVKASRDGTLRPVHVQELGLRHVTSRRVPNCASRAGQGRSRRLACGARFHQSSRAAQQ